MSQWYAKYYSCTYIIMFARLSSTCKSSLLEFGWMIKVMWQSWSKSNVCLLKRRKSALKMWIYACSSRWIYIICDVCSTWCRRRQTFHMTKNFLFDFSSDKKLNDLLKRALSKWIDQTTRNSFTLMRIKSNFRDKIVN